MVGFYLTLIDTDEDKSQFEKIYNQYKAVLITIAYQILKDKYLSEDAVHEAFLALAKNMDKIKDRNYIQTRNYLIIIVKNASYKIYNKRKNETPFEVIYDDIPDLHNIEIDTESKEAQRKLMELIKELDEKYSDVLILKYFYELTDKEIADSLGITFENAKIRLYRGKNYLKQKLSEVNLYDGKTI